MEENNLTFLHVFSHASEYCFPVGSSADILVSHTLLEGKAQ